MHSIKPSMDEFTQEITLVWAERDPMVVALVTLSILHEVRDRKIKIYITRLYEKKYADTKISFQRPVRATKGQEVPSGAKREPDPQFLVPSAQREGTGRSNEFYQLQNISNQLMQHLQKR